MFTWYRLTLSEFLNLKHTTDYQIDMNDYHTQGWVWVGSSYPVSDTNYLKQRGLYANK
jgi:hypothetical protein